MYFNDFDPSEPRERGSVVCCKEHTKESKRFKKLDK